MGKFKIHLGAFLIAWIVWFITLLLVFVFLSNQPMGLWPTPIRALFVLLAFIGIVPGIIAIAIVDEYLE